jgi:hypothetical protein
MVRSETKILRNLGNFIPSNHLSLKPWVVGFNAQLNQCVIALVEGDVLLYADKSVIPEVFYRESIAEYGFPIKDFGNDERLVGYELTGCNTRLI